MKFSFEVKRSSIDGKGLFAESSIPARRKLGELCGEHISQKEGRKRARQMQRITIVELGNGMAIDASREGNEFRFINHSCSPNAYMRIFRNHVEFYSLRKISIGEEITCNYGETHHQGDLKCGCKSPNCREKL
jgi:uncharacterized protein